MGVRREPNGAVVYKLRPRGLKARINSTAFTALKAPLFHVSKCVRGLSATDETVSSHTELPQQIAAGFPHCRIGALQGAVRARVRPGRHVHGTDALVLEQSLDAEYVIGVADGHATVQSVGAHDHSYTHGRLSSVGTLGFG